MISNNKQLFFCLFCLLFIPVGMMAQQKLLTLDDLIPGGKTYSHFTPESLRQLQWCNEEYLYVKGEEVRGGTPGKQEQILFTKDLLNSALEAIAGEQITNIPAFSVPYKDKPVLAFIGKGHRYHYDYKANHIVADYTLPAQGANYDFSSGNAFLAFTDGNNVKILTPENEVITVTNESDPGIVSGQSVHQREFSIRKGLFWSPSGKALAFYRMDETMVTDYPIVDVSTRVATAKPFKYPMSGMKSHEVTVGVFYPETKETVWLNTGLPKEKYLTNITWSPDEKSIYIAELNRDQNDCHLVRYNALTGEQEVELFRETATDYVEPQHPALFLPKDQNRFIWQSERDGYNHLYLYNTSGELIKQLSSGPWVVSQVLGFDEKGESLFYLSTAPVPGDATDNKTALNRSAWKINLKSGKHSCITPQNGVHNVSLSRSGEYIIDNLSSPDIVREIHIINTKNGQSYSLLKAPNPFNGYKLPDIEVGQIKAADGLTDLNYRLVKPLDLDKNKKYPVIIYVYGGPHTQLVNGSWNYGVRGWDLYMAQMGYVVFTLDGRGSANRGHAFESAIFRQLGVNEMADQVKGVDFLGSLPYVDTEQIGVHGWSYGGFMTTNLMLSYPEIFKVGVAGGPVIDWNMYEIMYGERYMDHPDDNPEGYKNSNLNLKAGNLKGDLLLIHGDVDPVVVWQHSLSFLKACVDAGTYPDYFVYPGHPHNVTGKDRPHLYQKITRYFLDKLPPEGK